MFIDLTGRVFGRWTAVERVLGGELWECRCACGIERKVSGNNLRSGKTKSCGCVDRSGDNNPLRRAVRKKHGTFYVPKESPWYGRAASIRARSKNSGVEFGFASICECASYLIEIAPACCPVFGVQFNCATGGGFSDWAPSVDRKDNSRGYVRGNLQIISMKANAMKATATADELLAFASWIIAQRAN